MNINCIPESIFSWNFRLQGNREKIFLKTNWMTEQGSLSIGNRHYEISKQGFMSGQWHLLEQGQLLWQAHKPNPLTRRFELSSEDQKSTLAPTGLGRTMRLQGPNISLTLSPNHPFTRRATIQGQGDDPVQTAFAFWLTILIWRRAARSSNHSSSS